MATNNALNNSLAGCSALPVPGGLSATGTPSATTFLRGDGSWSTPAGTGVTSVSGTSNRTTSSGGTTPTIDIAATYVGQSSITTLGTIGTGTWNGSTITVPFGGSGVTSATAYALLCGGTTSTGAFQSTVSGSAGQVLQSAGNAALPAYSTFTISSTFAVNNLVYASSINTLGGLATANSGVLVTSAGGVPSISTTLPNSLAMGTPASLTLTNATGLPVAGGGTGRATATAYAVLCGGTTSTGAHQSTASGSAGQVLQSNGNAALPTYSTPTYPSASGSAGTILRSDGTNNAYTTFTIPNTFAVSTLVYASSANVLAALATANNGVLVTSAGGVPSISSTLPAAVVAAIPGRLVSRTIIATGGTSTYNVPAGITSLYVQCYAGGGGGGGSLGGGSTFAAAGGGGAGGYAEVWLASGLSASYSYTCGFGGGGGSAGNNAGSNGNPTSFGSTLASASGGIGGSGSAGVASTGALVSASGAGGAGTVGDIQTTGQAGGVGLSVSGQLMSGAGGGSQLGFGGAPRTTAGTGNFGNSYGGGGGGGASTTVSNGGGGGSDGRLVIWEFA